MEIKNIINWKTAMFGACLLALAACGSDSDGDGDGDKLKGIEKDLIGVWSQKGCEYDEDHENPYSRRTLEFKAGGVLILSGQEYTDNVCMSAATDPNSSWEDEMTYTIGEKFDQGEGGSSGYEIDISFTEDDEERTLYTIISDVRDDGFGEYFRLGDDTGDLDAESEENRPDEFNNEDTGQFIKDLPL